MKTTDKHCPRCNSLQKFGQQRRKVSKDEIEIFIKCRKCRWEQVIIRDNSDRIKESREIERLFVKAGNDPQLLRVLQKKLRNRNERRMDKE